jgi:hypothetical protein
MSLRLALARAAENQSANLLVGASVEARYEGSTRYYPGRIAANNFSRGKHTYDVIFDDGGRDRHVRSGSIRPLNTGNTHKHKQCSKGITHSTSPGTSNLPRKRAAILKPPFSIETKRIGLHEQTLQTGGHNNSNLEIKSAEQIKSEAQHHQESNQSFTLHTSQQSARVSREVMSLFGIVDNGPRYYGLSSTARTKRSSSGLGADRISPEIAKGSSAPGGRNKNGAKRQRTETNGAPGIVLMYKGQEINTEVTTLPRSQQQQQQQQQAWWRRPKRNSAPPPRFEARPASVCTVQYSTA